MHLPPLHANFTPGNCNRAYAATLRTWQAQSLESVVPEATCSFMWRDAGSPFVKVGPCSSFDCIAVVCVHLVGSVPLVALIWKAFACCPLSLPVGCAIAVATSFSIIFCFWVGKPRKEIFMAILGSSFLGPDMFETASMVGAALRYNMTQRVGLSTK